MLKQEDFRPVGVYDLQGLQKKVTEQCNQRVPLFRAVFISAEFMGVALCTPKITSVDVTERSCYYAGAGKARGSYIRVGDAELPMTMMRSTVMKAYRKHVR